MPSKPRRPCTAAGCPREAVYHGKCAIHAKEFERQRGTSTARGYDKEWRKIRAAYLVAHPICEVCGKALATEVHHKNPLPPRGTGTHDWLNLQARCKPCHSRRTLEESVG